MIKCLPKEVQGKLRSGVALSSLQQCVEELVLNSIDAGATCVGVRMDMDAFKVQVIDNGRGMVAQDLSCVGNRYYTSKCQSIEDLENLSLYGFRGEALASIVSLATLVEISSRTKASVKTHVKMFKEGKALDVFEAETSRPSAGTTVTVCNYFYNMPVRRRALDAVLESERIKQRVEAISLMHPSVSFTLKNDCTGAMVVQLSKARDTYHRFVQIHSLARAQKLGEIHYTSGQFEVKGYIGKEGHYNNTLQFVYVNERLLLRTRIHKLLNALLRRLRTSNNQRNESPENHRPTRSPKQKRSQDLYGVFVINLKCSYSEYDICLEPAKTLIEFKDWDDILHCIKEAVKDFLKREELVADLSQDDMECDFPQRDTVDLIPDKRVPVNNFPKADLGIETALSSGSVYRSHKDRSGSTLENEEKMQPSESTEELEQNSGTFKGETSNLQTTVREVKETSEESSTISAEKLGLLSPEPPKVKPGCQSGLEAKSDTFQTSANMKKITLSNPHVHESLQTKQPCKYSGCLQKPKRKISLGLLQNTSLKEVVKEATPLKIRKIVSPSVVSQTLDQFRRTYGKPEHIFPMNCPSFEGMDCDKKVLAFDATHTKEVSGHELMSPPTLTTFTEIKPSILKQQPKPLAAKLCHLSQRNKKELVTELPAAEPASLADSASSNGSIQENEDHCKAECSPEPESGPSPGQKTTSDKWLPHFDPSVGKTVYVNKVTGLSSYEEPPAEQARTHCTSDVTNMAVSVTSEAGMEYICYPFQMDIVHPFLPSSRAGRVCWSGIEDRGVSATGEEYESSNSLYSMYSKWSNPVYVRPPKVCVDISRGQADGLSVKVHNILFPYRFTKAMIPTMTVINQVDRKFLACLIDTREDPAVGASRADGNLLVLVDQHAAHERVRLENLISEAFDAGSDASEGKALSSSMVSPAVEISFSQEEHRLLRSCGAQLQKLGLEILFSQEGDPRMSIRKVPRCFIEKDMSERKRGRPSVIRLLVEEYLQEQVELLRSAGRLRATLPLTVQKVLASSACHGAIKFNDILNKGECSSLVASLSDCQLPFQCAHGRPSIAPLVDLSHLNKEEKEMLRPNLSRLRRMYKAWQLFGNR